MLALFFIMEQWFNNSGIHTLTLQAGKYKIHCNGAQGGGGYLDNQLRSKGGRGAYVYGDLKIKGEKKFFVYVGGQGSSSEPKGPNKGGFNGGGDGGRDTKALFDDGCDAAGGGGGSTDIRYDKDVNTRIIVAAGGSGGAGNADGAPGGTLQGRYRFCIGPGVWPNMECKEYPVYNSTRTTQTSGSLNIGVGENGEDGEYVSGSGAGGGWQGGLSSYETSGGTSCYDRSIADSGSSYISGYDGCILNDLYSFENANMIEDVNEGDGFVHVEDYYICKNNCADCTSGNDCISCMDSYKLYKDSCYLVCPDGTRVLDSKNCEACQISDCKKCSQSANSCEVCNDEYNLLIENGMTSCVKECKIGQMASSGRCVDCNNKCSTCSISVDFCDSCNDEKFQFDGNCYVKCTELNNDSDKKYYGQDNSNRKCRQCSDNNCIDCSSDFDQCNECSNLYYVDKETHKCILKATEVFTESQKFSNSDHFTNTGSFTNSKHFTNSDYFTNTGSFTNSKHFTNSEQFANSDSFTNSDHFTDSKSFSNSQEFSPSVSFEPISDTEIKSTDIEQETYDATSIYETLELTISEQETDLPSSEQTTDEEVILPTSEPIDPTRYSCLLSFIDKNITLYDRCMYIGSNTYNVIASLIRVNFNNFINESHGGAIFIQDCALEFTHANFTDCISLKGYGGAIYVNNSNGNKNDIYFENLIFTRCKSSCGGAALIYSSSENSNATFLNCSFYSNEINDIILDKKDGIFGGSAFFLSARNGHFYGCLFKGNKGSKSALKIYNNFKPDETKIKSMKYLERSSNHIVVSNCKFEIKNDSNSSIFYVNGKYGSDIEIANCDFDGKSDTKFKYIDGKELDQYNIPKLKIISCNFQYKTAKIKYCSLLISFISISFAVVFSFLAIIKSIIYFSSNNKYGENDQFETNNDNTNNIEIMQKQI